jgi:hypothetical protein
LSSSSKRYAWVTSTGPSLPRPGEDGIVLRAAERFDRLVPGTAATVHAVTKRRKHLGRVPKPDHRRSHQYRPQRSVGAEPTRLPPDGRYQTGPDSSGAPHRRGCRQVRQQPVNFRRFRPIGSRPRPLHRQQAGPLIKNTLSFRLLRQPHHNRLAHIFDDEER